MNEHFICVRSVALVTSLLSLAACAVQTPEAEPATRLEERPISGGYDDDGDPAVVAVVALFGGASICTGTLIAPNVVLTAQHCVAQIENKAPNGGVDCSASTFGATHEPNFFQYTTSAVLSFDTSIYRPVAEMIVPPQANWACGYDIALIRLADPVDPATAMFRRPRVDEPLFVPTPNVPASGEEYSAVGYGEATDGGNDSGRRRRRDGLFATCGEGNCGGVSALFMTDTEWRGDTGICQGDSGGPAFDMQGRVIGVANRGGAECTSPIYASVFAWRVWIKEQVIAAAAKGGIEPPPWALDWPTHPDYNHPIGDVCGDDQACPSGTCIGGVCSRKCNDLSPCGADFLCNSDGYCELAEVGADCASATECESGRCDDGRCTRRCFEGLWACPENWTCADGSDLCEPQPVGSACQDSSDCGGGSCADGLCTRPCEELGCPDGWTCDGVCTLLPVGDVCQDEGDCASQCLPLESDPEAAGRCTRPCGVQAPCPLGWACDQGQCVLPEVGSACTSDDDCSQGATCGPDNTCTRPCDPLSPCPIGFGCATEASSSTQSGMCEANPPGTEEAGCTVGSKRPPLGALAVAFGVMLFAALRRRRAGLDYSEKA